MRVLSADWVVPVEGPPIRDGAVAFENGTIVEVGPAAQLGPGEQYRDAVILPGFVNAHTHLEYAAYTGFGDGLSFGPWIALHVERKARIDLDDMQAIARFGALECLRSGITAVGDCSFSGAAATACADVGLRGIVFLEVFGNDDSPVVERFEPMRWRIAGDLSESVRVGVSPHAPYTCSLDLYRACDGLGLPVATHLAESEAETAFLRTGEGIWQAFAEMLVRPLGTTGIRALAEAGLLGAHVLAAHCVQADGEEPLVPALGPHEERDEEPDAAAVHVLEAAEVQHYGAGAARRGLRVRIHEDVLTEGGDLPLYVHDVGTPSALANVHRDPGLWHYCLPLAVCRSRRVSKCTHFVREDAHKVGQTSDLEDLPVVIAQAAG